MNYIKFLLCVFLFIISFNCGNSTGYDNKSMIKLELEYILPKQSDEIAINSQIIIAFNMPVDSNSINNDTIQVIADDGSQLDIRWEIMDNIIIGTSKYGQYLQQKTHYKINIHNVIGRNGNKIKITNAAHFITGDFIDSTPPTPIFAKAKEHFNEVIIFFDEPILQLNIHHDAIDLFDITKNTSISGTISTSEKSNQLYFKPDEPILLNHKYRINVRGKKGIMDLANNEYIDGSDFFEIYPEPYIDKESPYIEYVETHIVDQMLTIHFSEKIEIQNLFKPEFNKEYYKTLNEPIKVLVYLNRGIEAWSGNLLGLLYMKPSSTMNTNHNKITISFPDNNLTAGDVINIKLLKNAFFDLKGNSLYNKFADDLNHEKYLSYVIIQWTVPELNRL